MRRRLLGVVAVIALLLVVFPIAATAQTSNTARITSTSYLDGAGSETDPLCEQTSTITTTVNYSGLGPELGGSGTGELTIDVEAGSVAIFGTIDIDGSPATIEAFGGVTCLLGSFGFVQGEITVFGGEIVNGEVGALALEEGEVVVGTFSGTLTDGVHPRQGRLFLMLSGELIEDPA